MALQGCFLKVTEAENNYYGRILTHWSAQGLALLPARGSPYSHNASYSAQSLRMPHFWVVICVEASFCGTAASESLCSSKQPYTHIREGAPVNTLAHQVRLDEPDFGVVVTLLSHECPIRGMLTSVLCLPEASHSAKVERYQFRWSGRTTVVGLVICGACGQYLGLQPMPPSQDCTLVQSLLYFTAKCHWSTETFCQISLLAKFKEVHFIVTSLILNDEHFIHLFLFFSGSVIKYIKWQIHFSFGLLLWFGY